MAERVSKRGQVAQVVERSPEKAGVGGSTPSLATIIPKNLTKTCSNARSPRSVRIENRYAKPFLQIIDGQWLSRNSFPGSPLSVRFGPLHG